MKAKMKVKILKPISKGKTKKGTPIEFHKIGSVVEILDDEFSELKRLGYVERSYLSPKTKEKPKISSEPITNKTKL